MRCLPKIPEGGWSSLKLSQFDDLKVEDWRLLFQEGGQHRHRVLYLLHATVVDGVSKLQEPGSAVSLLGDYLDLVLVPMVLQRPSLREEALQCPCEHCSAALQAIHQLQRPSLARLQEAGALPFLANCLEEVSDDIHKAEKSQNDMYLTAVRASESLAVLSAFARLQENGSLYQVPQGVVRFLSRLLRHMAVNRAECTCTLALSLHILRNVARNHQEVMDTSAESFRECFLQLFAQETRPQQLVQAAVNSASNVLPPESEAGNPQESDEGPGSMMEASVSRALRCDETFSQASLYLQALFQSSAALQSLPVSEEEMRQKAITMSQKAREDLPQQHSRLAFQGIRLYLLICRSSHVRRQYAVLESSFLEQERRTVAFLLSISKDQHCLLLRAMAQDVHSWLMWQNQAHAKPSAGSEELRKRRPHKTDKAASRPQALGRVGPGPELPTEGQEGPSPQPQP
ncbi:unnamed protein product, partial [Effrenium voratum]